MAYGIDGIGDDLEAFRWRLAETSAWCSGRAATDDIADNLRRWHTPRGPQPAPNLTVFAGVLRTPALQPATYDESEIWRGRQVLATVEPVPQGLAIVDRLVAERARLLRLEGSYPRLPARDLARGRLLVYFPDRNFFDGTAEYVSGGFFDVDNIPPWDTWLCLLPSEEGRSWSASLTAEGDPGWWGFSNCCYLVSWVPPQFVPLAAEAVKVAVMDCLVWSEWVDSTFMRRLRATGLLEPLTVSHP